MAIHHNVGIDASELAIFRQLKGSSGHRQQDFVVEGAFLAEKAHADGMVVTSMMMEEKMLARFQPLLAPGVPVYVQTRQQMSDCSGFDFHRGVLTALRKPKAPETVSPVTSTNILVLPCIDGAESMGLLLRSAAGLGIDEVWVGGGISPYSRRVARVSMGGCWSVPLREYGNQASLLQAVKKWQHDGGELCGMLLAEHAMQLSDWRPSNKGIALVLGPEAYGLDDNWVEAINMPLVIPMARQMDSLNVAVAGAIAMHHLMAHTR